MATKSSIEWTESTWNPLTGCTKVSPGCKHCYAERMAKRLRAMGQPNYANGFKLTLYFLLRGGGDYVKRLHEAMTAYGVDTYRSDFGPPSIELLDALAAIHPNFRHAHCSGGAPHKDFAMARRATVMFGLDVYDTLNNRMMFHVSSYCIHPAQLQSLINILSAPPAFSLRSAMQGACNIGIGGHWMGEAF